MALDPARRPRGRPRNAERPKTRQADDAIGLTVWQLLAWGYSLRRVDGIADVVAVEAATILKRTDSSGRPLGADRIEQIYKMWMRSARRQSGWFKEPVSYDRPWTRYQVRSLRDAGPPGAMRDIARSLLMHGGHWSDASLPRRLGDKLPTAKTADEWKRMPKMKWQDGETG